jgi:hypothetical protein
MAITPVTLYFTTPPATTTNAGGATYTNVQIPLAGDDKVLAYALAAELLEATLYQQAYLHLTGAALPASPANTTPPSIVTDALGYSYGASGNVANLGVATTDAIAEYLAEFAAVEFQHAAFLNSALGSPYANLSPGNVVSFAFGLNTLTTKEQVAELVYTAELIGVSAYTGAVPSFTQQSPYLQIAASILGTEARHTAALAATLNTESGTSIETAPMYNEPSYPGGRDVPLTPDQILNTGGSGVPGALNNAGTASVGGSGGTIGPISGPNGAAIGAAQAGGSTTYNGFVYLIPAA